ncbi:DUF433 domain-containing protein [Rhodoplanes sp. SY1]|uniref:DUF433 domain-containing protein n=1 Tax=Rhodoplanes sp. SY1 TaxID=3166646 RepID=UPI0038B55F5E
MSGRVAAEPDRSDNAVASEVSHDDAHTVDPAQMGGVPCIRGLRIPAATVVGMLADGMSHAEILAALPDLEPEDITEALRFAADALRERAGRSFLDPLSRHS